MSTSESEDRMFRMSSVGRELNNDVTADSEEAERTPVVVVGNELDGGVGQLLIQIIHEHNV